MSPEKDQDAVIVLDAGIAYALARCVDGHAPEPVEEGRDAALQVELIVELAGGRRVGNAVAELQRADRSLDAIRRR
jgi:hypothetical protein